MFEFEKPYHDVYRTKRLKVGSTPKVLHRKTCPACNTKLVNLYYSETEKRHLCKACLEKAESEGGASRGEA